MALMMGAVDRMRCSRRFDIYRLRLELECLRKSNRCYIWFVISSMNEANGPVHEANGPVHEANDPACEVNGLTHKAN